MSDVRDTRQNRLKLGLVRCTQSMCCLKCLALNRLQYAHFHKLFMLTTDRNKIYIVAEYKAPFTEIISPLHASGYISFIEPILRFTNNLHNV